MSQVKADEWLKRGGFDTLTQMQKLTELWVNELFFFTARKAV